ncbi:MarR family transcriptional regulator [Planctomycetota bacterium]|nr:MarR family transcriptional regulator [Planctomycetota bacterium]
MKKQMQEIMKAHDLLGDLLVFKAIHRADKAGLDVLSDLTGRQIHVMVGLSRVEPCSLKQAAKRMGVSQASACVMVDTLVGKGMLERVQDEEDRRRVLISLTDKVRKSLAVVDDEILKNYLKFAGMLGEEVVERWHGVMKELSEVINEQRDEFES